MSFIRKMLSVSIFVSLLNANASLPPTDSYGDAQVRRFTQHFTLNINKSPILAEELLTNTSCVEILEELNEDQVKIDLSNCDIHELPPGSIMLMADNVHEGEGTEN